MRILDVLQREAILNNLKSQDKIGVLQELVEPVAHITGISHEDLMGVLLEREKLGTTGIGEGIGIPHGKLKDLERQIYHELDLDDGLLLVYGDQEDLKTTRDLLLSQKQDFKMKFFAVEDKEKFEEKFREILKEEEE